MRDGGVKEAMSHVRALPNIGDKLASDLMQSGIATSSQLVEVGSVGAALQLELHDFSVCANTLYALEGAIRGIRWHDIPSEERQKLWNAFKEQ